MKILDEIYAERRRQLVAEGWTPEHDDEHDFGELAVAAGVYLLHLQLGAEGVTTYWPWDFEWFKPARFENRRRDLIKAAALIVAELERLGRKAAA